MILLGVVEVPLMHASTMAERALEASALVADDLSVLAFSDEATRDARVMKSTESDALIEPTVTAHEVPAATGFGKTVTVLLTKREPLH
jgi:hypothetical protein